MITLVFLKCIDKLHLICIGMLFLAGLHSCSQPDSVHSNKETDHLVDMHNSRNSLDWPGVYRGVLPCADCEGIRMELQLKDDLTYDMTTQYLGENDQVFLITGSFEWNAAGSRIKLKDLKESAGHRLFQVGENRLFMLDRDGNRIQGDLATWYILEKVKEKAE